MPKSSGIFQFLKEDGVPLLTVNLWQAENGLLKTFGVKTN